MPPPPPTHHTNFSQQPDIQLSSNFHSRLTWPRLNDFILKISSNILFWIVTKSSPTLVNSFLWCWNACKTKSWLKPIFSSVDWQLSSEVIQIWQTKQSSINTSNFLRARGKIFFYSLSPTLIYHLVLQGSSSLHLDWWFRWRTQIKDKDSWFCSELCWWLACLELWWQLHIPGLHHSLYSCLDYHILQAEGSNSDTYLHPVKIYPDPFRGGDNIMVMCETYKYDKTPTDTNHRQWSYLGCQTSDSASS